MNTEQHKPSGTAGWRGAPLPRTVWALGFVSLFMDISSEMIHSLLPLFLVTALQTSALAVGVIEGVAEATALITKIFSGALSDRLQKRKGLVFAGYALGTLTKPVFALANHVGLVFGARFIDRVGKGIRGAPRDALIADVTPPASRGGAFGLRQSLDTVGAFLGPSLAAVLMYITTGNFRLVFWVAAIPGVLALVTLLVAVKEPARGSTPQKQNKFHWQELKTLQPAYWLVVAVGFTFTLARFSEAFLLLRAVNVGLSVSLAPLVMVLMNVVYSLTAYPVGLLSDRFGRSGLLAGGLIALILADLVLAAAGAIWQIALGIVFWGFHMGMTQGLLSALVADTVPASLRGTAFGIFGLMSGIAILGASLIAGWLWSAFGPPATFLAGALLAALTLLAYAAQRFKSRS